MFENVAVREMLCILRQHRFQTVPDGLLLPLETCFKGFQQSAVNDIAHNVIRDHLRDTKSGTMRHHERWMLPHVESVLKSFGCEELVPQASHRGGNRQMPPAAFDGLAGAPPRQWQTRSLQSNNVIPSAMHLFVTVAGPEQWENTRRSWQGVFRPVGAIVKQQGCEECYLVLNATRWAVLMWPCTSSVRGSDEFVVVRTDSVADVSWATMLGLSDWTILLVQPSAP